MRRVQGFEVNTIRGPSIIMAPIDAPVLSVASHENWDSIVVWMEVDDSKEQVARTFASISTNEDIPPNAVHRGTWVQVDKEEQVLGYVWHVYEIV